MGTSDSEYVIVGKVLAPWGVRGKLKIEVITDFPERFTPSSQVYVNQQPFIIEQSQWHKGALIIKLDAISSAEEAGKLRGRYLEIPAAQLHPLPEGQYYLFQIIGLDLFLQQRHQIDLFKPF